jgi:4a-hydroxytetrahydrobiopterin dehydratase
MLLTDAEIDEALRALPGWTRVGKALQRTYRFAGFPEAVAFVDSLVAPAEALGHHPDVAISYNTVVVTLTTHDAGGLTAKDLALAKAMLR